MIIKSTNRSFIFISVHLLPFLHLNWCVYAGFFLESVMFIVTNTVEKGKQEVADLCTSSDNIQYFSFWS